MILIGCCFSFPTAKVQQIFGIYKDFSEKKQIYLVFTLQALLFAQLRDRTFGGTLLS